jgi:aspartate racemase
MPGHIGIVGCSAEGAALCYRVICSEGANRLGEHSHPEITMHTYPLAQYMVPIRSGNWKQVADLMVRSAEKLAQCGAQFAICPDNTIHQAYEFVVERSPIPWLHIADSVAVSAQKRGFCKLGITGTKYLMAGPVYSESLERYQLDQAIPDAEDRERIDEIIFGELVNGVFSEESRQYFNGVFSRLKDQGCDAVVLGCTEIPLLIDPSDSPLPTLDSTRLLARAALERSLASA